MWAVAILAGAAGALAVAALQLAGAGFQSTRTIRTVEQIAPTPTSYVTSATTSAGQAVEAVAARLRPSIVRLDVETPAGTSFGSGVIFRSDGAILTNEHVTHGALHISVVTASGRRYTGTLVGADPDTDISVVRVHGGAPWPVAALGSAANLRAGQSVVAIGSASVIAAGPSVSRGVVSGLGRQLTTADGELLDMIQTDAATIAGTSGGALVDLTGAVVGVCTEITASITGSDGGSGSSKLADFATPIDIAHRIAEELVDTGHASHVWLGIGGTDVGPAQADQLSIDGGALVDTVKPGSPAAKAGLRHGDVIAALDGNPVMSMSSLMVSLRSHRPGDKVVLGVIRAEKPAAPMTVILVARPGDD
jgi:putative serine protease PepD